MIVPVILSGGSGTRLWPLSREQVPKQLLSLVSDQSLLQDTVRRLDSFTAGPIKEPVVVCNKVHGSLIGQQLGAIGHGAARLIYEPIGRNTAPAVAIAALLTEETYPGEESVLLVLPADHVIKRPDSFAEAVVKALPAAGQGFLVTFGILPERAETGYGYIKRGARRGDLFDVEKFVEKPDKSRAASYVESGDYYWNSGMFMFEAAAYLSELQRFAPDILSACRKALEGAIRDDAHVELGHDAFFACPSDSIDYAVMESTDKAAVIPLEAGWSDLGSWTSLHEAEEHDDAGNTCIGNTITLNCRNSHVQSDNRLVVGIGVDDMVIVDSGDTVLVAQKAQSQLVKDVVTRLKAEGRKEASVPSRRYYPWGTDELLSSGGRSEVRKLELHPETVLSFSSDANAGMRCIVISGAAHVASEKEVRRVREGELVTLMPGEHYSLENRGRIPLIVLAVLTGNLADGGMSFPTSSSRAL